MLGFKKKLLRDKNDKVMNISINIDGISLVYHTKDINSVYMIQ